MAQGSQALERTWRGHQRPRSKGRLRLQSSVKMMKALCVSLVAALCFGLADSLTCYNCTTTSDNCLTAVQCATGDKYCRTVVNVASGVTEVMKTCNVNCSSGQFEATLSFFTCCQTDLCNKGGASGSQRVSYSGMSLALGLSAMLFKAVL